MFPNEDEVDAHRTVAKRVNHNGLNHYLGDLPERILRKKHEDWNKLLEDEEFFEEYVFSKKGWPDEDWALYRQEILLARLIISTSEFLAGEQNELSKEFTEKVYQMVQTYEEFAIFGDPQYTKELIIQKIARGDKTVIGFIKKFCEKRFYEADKLTDELTLDKQVVLALNSRYNMIFKKIGNAIIDYIKNHQGTWVKVFTDIDEAYKEILDSHEVRARLQDEMDKNILAQEKLQELENFIEDAGGKRDEILRTLSHKEKELLDEKSEKSILASEIEELESQKNALAAQNTSMLEKWDGVFAQVEARRRELEEKEKQLEAFKIDMKKENKTVLEDELQKVREMTSDLKAKENEFESIKKGLEHQNEALSIRLRKMRKSLETGERGAIVKSSEALAMNISFINNVRKNMMNHLMTKGIMKRFKPYGINYDAISHSEQDHAVNRYDREGEDPNVAPALPSNRSVVLKVLKKHILAKDELQMIIEGVVITHEVSYRENGFDNVSVSLSEVLSRIQERIRNAEGKAKLHVIYLGSPTGFDSDVIDRFGGEQIGKGLGFDNLVIFLQDLKDSSSKPLFNSLDKKAMLFSDFLRVFSDDESIGKCRSEILKVLASKSAMAFPDIVAAIGMDPLDIKKALDELVEEGVVGRDEHDDFDTIYFKRTEA